MVPSDKIKWNPCAISEISSIEFGQFLSDGRLMRRRKVAFLDLRVLFRCTNRDTKLRRWSSLRWRDQSCASNTKKAL